MQLFLLLNLHEILKIYMDFSGKIWYNPLVAAPFWQQKGGVHIVSIFFSSVGIGRCSIWHHCWTNHDYTSQVVWPEEEVKSCGNQTPQKNPLSIRGTEGICVCVHTVQHILFCFQYIVLNHIFQVYSAFKILCQIVPMHNHITVKLPSVLYQSSCIQNCERKNILQ